MLQGVFYESNCFHVTGKFIAIVLEARNWTLFCTSLMQLLSCVPKMDIPWNVYFGFKWFFLEIFPQK
jgi:hypothetical protein